MEACNQLIYTPENSRPISSEQWDDGAYTQSKSCTENSLPLPGIGNQILGQPARSLLSISTELFWVLLRTAISELLQWHQQTHTSHFSGRNMQEVLQRL
jgi:hypothetical protein